MMRLTLHTRERKLALGAGVLITVWLVVSWIGQPLWERFHLLQQETEISEKKMERLRRLAARKPQIERQYQAYAGFWSEERDEAIQRMFLDELEQLARAEQLPISVRPRPIQQDGRRSRIGVEVEIDGTQAALLGFLDRLFTAPQLIELSRLRISATVSKEHPLRGSLLVTKVVLHS